MNRLKLPNYNFVSTYERKNDFFLNLKIQNCNSFSGSFFNKSFGQVIIQSQSKLEVFLQLMVYSSLSSIDYFITYIRCPSLIIGSPIDADRIDGNVSELDGDSDEIMILHTCMS